jgi:diamine N-acetyltransferase
MSLGMDTVVSEPTAELTMGRLSLGRATPSDLPFIMETERLPGFDKMVGRWTADQHKAAYSKPSYAYLIGTEIGGEAFGFAIIRDLDDPHGNVCLKRIATVSPGRGYGTPFLGMVLDWVFREATAYRVWLDVLADNDRAQHVYMRGGFTKEGLLRRAYKLPDESRIDLILMSILRPEWLKQRLTRSTE